MARPAIDPVRRGATSSLIHLVLLAAGGVAAAWAQPDAADPAEAAKAAETAVASPLEEAWARVATLQFPEAAAAFAQTLEQAPADREARLGRALLRLQAQPRTAAGIERALAELEALAAEEPDDEAGITAAFLAARVLQRHREPAQPDEAAARYRQLADARPAHPLGQMAWVRWATAWVYSPENYGDEVARRLARLEREGAALTEPVARRDFHLLMSMVYPQLAPSDEAMLRHLLATEATGLLRWQSRRDVYVRIVETALALGKLDRAAEYVARVEREYPRDARRQLLRERLDAAQDAGREAGGPS